MNINREDCSRTLNHENHRSIGMKTEKNQETGVEMASAGPFGYMLTSVSAVRQTNDGNSLTPF